MNTPEILQQKLDIAKRAGELHNELATLVNSKRKIAARKSAGESLHIVLDNNHSLTSHYWEKGGTTLHDLVIGWIDVQIAQREAEVNDLIKILS